MWRDLSWHETVGHARDWLALSMLNDETQDAIEKFLERAGAVDSADGRRGPHSRDGGVLTITLTGRRSYNAFNRALHDALHDGAGRGRDPAVRACRRHRRGQVGSAPART